MSPPKKRLKLILNTEIEKMDRPLILEDTKGDSVPLHLTQLMSQYEEQLNDLTSSEILTLLVYLLALEMGFVEEQIYLEKADLLKPVPTFSSFHAVNVHLITQQPVVYSTKDSVYSIVLRTLVGKYVPKEKADLPVLRARLVLIVLADQLMVTLSPAPPSQLPGYSISLSIGRYVLSIYAKHKPIYYRFAKLKELSMLLKEQIFYPMRVQQFEKLGQYLQPSLVGLPDLVYPEIFQYFNCNEMNIVANVNHHLNWWSNQHIKNRRSN